MRFLGNEFKLNKFTKFTSLYYIHELITYELFWHLEGDSWDNRNKYIENMLLLSFVNVVAPNGAVG